MIKKSQSYIYFFKSENKILDRSRCCGFNSSTYNPGYELKWVYWFFLLDFFYLNIQLKIKKAKISPDVWA
jgi:hypothetical protein